jgi:pseudouridylate synthase
VSAAIHPRIELSDEVASALREGRPVVALESSLIAQGLPSPHNLETARAAEAAVRAAGATPATTAIDAGRLVLGASSALLERLADPGARAAKAGARDLGPFLARGRLASTTVSASMRIAHMAGIPVFATGGIGGVHRGAGSSFDVSSDIDELAATPVAVVCSGAKSILDLPATMEVLETRRVPVVGLATDQLPAFYAASSGLPLPHVADDAADAAAAFDAHRSLPGVGAMLFVQPPPAEVALPADEVEAWVEEAVAEASRQGIRGGALTPFVLSRIGSASEGRALRANIGLIINNARVAAEIAIALAARG